MAALALTAPARAEDRSFDLASRETLTVAADLRLTATDGEPSWTQGGFGKLRFGGAESGELRARSALGEAALVWQPRLSWALSGTVVGVVQGGSRTEAGLSEAFLTFKPLGDGAVRISARAGLMWPPVSLEHAGPEWAVTDTITPSAINSWIGEEVKVVAAEGSARVRLGGQTLTATAAVFDLNDTAGALLAFRGWGLHDRVALAFRRQPLPPLNEFMEYVQPRYSHPLLDADGGVLRRPGYYVKLAWDLPLPLHLEALHYDNDGDPEAVLPTLEWGWRTRFDDVGFIAEPASGWQLRGQALAGRTEMGPVMDGRRWIDMRFRAAYALLTRHFATGSLSARVDVFGTRNRGTAVTGEADESGWAATIAARRKLTAQLSAVVEYLHVESRREAREDAGLAAQQTQNQVQLAMRMRL
ncbi:MAG: hypothetical protein JF593_05325 [Novosphingobium sp.]|nr:hypothetical protein [Novosphingobium sp.]